MLDYSAHQPLPILSWGWIISPIILCLAWVGVFREGWTTPPIILCLLPLPMAHSPLEAMGSAPIILTFFPTTLPMLRLLAQLSSLPMGASGFSCPSSPAQVGTVGLYVHGAVQVGKLGGNRGVW